MMAVDAALSGLLKDGMIDKPLFFDFCKLTLGTWEFQSKSYLP
jgi:hypothetical protein